MRKILLGAAALSTTMVLAACGDDGGAPKVQSAPASTSTTSSPTSSSSSESTTSSSSTTSSTTSSSSSSTPAEYAVGDCFKGKSWEKVGCTEPHDREITAIVSNSEYSTDLIKRSALRNYTCLAEAGKYVGGPDYGSLFLGGPLPVAKDPKSNERIVCAVQLQKADDSGIEQINYSAKDAIKKNGFHKYQLCTSTPPSKDGLKIAPCDGPHVAESTWGFLDGKFGDPYPGAKAQNLAAHKRCQPFGDRYLGAKRADVRPVQNSAPESGFKRGIPVIGCFVETADGSKVTKSMKGLGNKPLSSVK